MVRNDRDGLRAEGIICIVVFLLGGPFVFIASTLGALQHHMAIEAYLTRSDLNLIIYSFLFLLLGSASLLQASHWKLVNHRRQMAAAWGFAARVPLAQPHPLPNIGALPVPFTITVKPNWPLFLAPLCGIAGLVLLLQTNLTFPGIGILEGIAVLLIILPLPCLPQQIEITSEGLTVGPTLTMWPGRSWRPKKWQSVSRWSDARLFAISGGKPGTPATRYELASPYAVVTWKRIRHPRWWSLYRPAIPFAEYDAQMEALIALISGITGLPLYDVR